MALVSVPYGGNVKAVVLIANTGGSSGTFQLVGMLYMSWGDISFWPNLVRSADPTSFSVPALGNRYKDTVVQPGQQAYVTMYTPPLWKPDGADPGDLYSYLGSTTFFLTCLETGRSSTPLINNYSVEIYGFKEVVVVPPTAYAASIQVSPTALNLEVGGSAIFTATVRDQYGAIYAGTVTWQGGSNVGVLTMLTTFPATSNTALFDAVSAGTGTISASCGGVSVSATITVAQPVVIPVAAYPAWIALSRLTLDLQVGGSTTLAATVYDQYGAVYAGTVAWQSNIGSLSVLSNTTALFTATSAGAGWVYVLCGDASASCAVTVAQPAAASPVDSWLSAARSAGVWGFLVNMNSLDANGYVTFDTLKASGSSMGSAWLPVSDFRVQYVVNNGHIWVFAGYYELTL